MVARVGCPEWFGYGTVNAGCAAQVPHLRFVAAPAGRQVGTSWESCHGRAQRLPGGTARCGTSCARRRGRPAAAVATTTRRHRTAPRGPGRLHRRAVRDATPPRRRYVVARRPGTTVERAP